VVSSAKKHAIAVLAALAAAPLRLRAAALRCHTF